MHQSFSSEEEGEHKVIPEVLVCISSPTPQHHVGHKPTQPSHSSNPLGPHRGTALLPRARLGPAVQKPALQSNAQGFEGQGKLLVRATLGEASCLGGDIAFQTKCPPR